MNRSYILAITTLLFISAGCRKEKLDKACSSLLKAMQTDNVPQAEYAITRFIDKLSSKTYNEKNLNQLASSLSGNCSITITGICFSCVLTLPEQTEMQLSYFNGTTTLQKVIDISYSTDNRMRFVNMHD